PVRHTDGSSTTDRPTTPNHRKTKPSKDDQDACVSPSAMTQSSPTETRLRRDDLSQLHIRPPETKQTPVRPAQHEPSSPQPRSSLLVGYRRWQESAHQGRSLVWKRDPSDRAS